MISAQQSLARLINFVSFPVFFSGLLIFTWLFFQMIFCGKGFTLAGTNDNDLYFWGTRPADYRRSQSESGEKTDTEGSCKRHMRNPSGSLSIGSADSLEISTG